ncbi:TonB-dependent receptor domain-containing protein [Chitinophaga sp. LS1]|uniref:TonB-dependent receptor domain-containing protein n=1 Tax=Chitinophaga sp. LS1 TaxID=3051176 RepID=UPI002AAB7FDB|nr:TonB-dependent receptor [Chitinophaga sp. LS1]WPV64574.1 TonB-dependent receptor [Chitinophaga sp. LS1]
MKLSLVLAILLLEWTYSSGQNKIKGLVQNKDNHQPVAYATIIINDPTTGKTINGTVANDQGAFEVNNLKKGKYNLTIDFIGYTRQELKGINAPLDLGTIYMVAGGKSLNEVVVTSRAPTIENKTDRIVYNVATDITSQGGVATDVLKKVPQVTVDIDGNVELQGNSNIRFLINGKPSSMFGNSLADALAAIPASQIKSIEAITSPGAKYDAQGTGGIINIILKDNPMQGMNGNVSLSAGTRLENGAVNLNFRKNKFGMNVFFSGNEQLTSHTPSTRTRYTFDTKTKMTQETNTDFSRKGYQTGFGFDYGNLTGGLSYSYFGNRSIASTYQQPGDIYFTSDTRNHTGSLDWNLGYRKQFKKEGRDLYFLYSGSSGSPYTSFVQGETHSWTPGLDLQHNFSVDYSHQVNQHLSFESGAKVILHHFNNTATSIPDTTQSYVFDYKMNIYAAYISAKFSLFHNYDVVAGGRYEYTTIVMGNIPSYGEFLPAVNISRKIGEDQSIKLAFTRRIERPDKELNPFVNLSDPYNITMGNPYLKPEIGNNTELGYSRNFKSGGNIYVGIMERINTNDLKTYTAYYATYAVGDSIYKDVTVTTRQNIGEEYNTGLILTSSLPLTKHLNIRENLMVINKHVVNHLDNGNKTDGLSWRLNVNAAYSFPKDLVAEAFGEYRSAWNSIQGRVPQVINYTVAFRKLFWHKNASIGLTATNPFNQYIRQLTTLSTSNYTGTYLRMVPYRSFGISMTYKFGKLQFKKEKEHGEDYLNNPPAM